MFVIKKIISAFLMPLSIGLLLSLTGLFYLWFTKDQKKGKKLITFGILFIILISINPLPNLFLSYYENKYASYKKGKEIIEYIVVLGGGVYSDKNLPLTNQIDSGTLIRLIEGIRIYHFNPGSKLIFSGYGKTISCVEAMANIVTSIGIKSSDIIIEPRPKDTKDEALLIKLILQKTKFVLVTSHIIWKGLWGCLKSRV